MDVYVELWDIFAWPLIVLALASAFRLQLAALLKRITSIEGKGIRANLAEGLAVEEAREPAANAKDQADHQSPEPAANAADCFDSWERNINAFLMKAARTAPQAAIEEAWAVIEAAIDKIRRAFLPHMSPTDVVWHLDVEPSKDLGYRFDSLRNLRELAILHGVKFDDAERFIKLAVRLADNIRTSGNTMFIDPPAKETG